MHKYIALVIAATISMNAHPVQYVMVKGDTLWDLSEKYLKDPFLWPQITYVDGTVVTKPRTMPIGTILLIPDDIANDRALLELPASTEVRISDNGIAQNSSSNNGLQSKTINGKKSHVSNRTIEAMIARLSGNQKNRLWNYYLVNNKGLVRAFHNGKEVVIEAQLLIDEMRHQQGMKK